MYPEDIEVPILLVAGWFDHNLREDFVMLDTLRNASLLGEAHKMLVGPWVHGGVGPAHVGTEEQGELFFPYAAGTNIEIERQFLDYHLFDEQNGWDDREVITYFQMGSDEWRTTDVWPPEVTEDATYYMHAGLQWVPNEPEDDNYAISYSYDPTDPSPTIGGPTLSDLLEQGPYDQVPEVESRPDMYAISTTPQLDSLEINGNVRVVLHIGSNMPDTDIMLRLTDVDEEGHSYLLNYTAQRMRFRNGFTLAQEELMSPGTVYEVEMDFPPLAHTVLPGHQLRVDVSSSNYPQYNRNANTGEEMYPDANPDSLVNPISAENTIRFSPFYDTRMILPIKTMDTHVQNAVKLQLSVFPIPASDKLTVLSPMPLVHWEIISIQGKVLAFAEEEWPRQFEIDLSRLPSGQYLLKAIAHDKSVWITPFVKQ